MSVRRLIAIAGLWTAAWILLTWGGLLDDALIHLRVAEMSRAAGFLTFDGSTPGFVSSSPAFVVLLIAAGAVITSPWLPQAIAAVWYAGCLAFAALRSLRGPAPRAHAVLLLVLVVPMGVRWMTNGMETSLAAFLALVLGARIATIRRPVNAATIASLAALSMAALLVRSELVAVTGCAMAVCLIAYGTRDGIAAAAALAAGTATSILTTYWMLGAVVPDAALAKATGLDSGLHGIAFTHLAAGTFGAGLAGLWLFATAAATARCRSARERAAVLFASLPVIVAFAAVVIRGQALQGVRYFVPFYLFTIGFGLAWLQTRDVEIISRRGLAIAAAALLAGALVEAGFVLRTQRTSADVLRRMAAQPLDRLAGVTGIAWDVGFIGYFTRAEICDVNGLVNGRERATASVSSRLAACAARNPRFAFLTAEEMPALEAAIDVRGWVSCDSYTVQMIGGRRTHRLLVAPDLAPAVCPHAASAAR